MIKIEGDFNTVNKLHKVLSELIEQGKGDLELKMDEGDYSWGCISEVKIYGDEPREDTVVILY